MRKEKLCILIFIPKEAMP